MTRLDASGRQTRQSEALVMPAIRSEAGRRRFLYSAVKMYNDLPSAMKQHGLPRFKRLLKKYLLERQRGDRVAPWSGVDSDPMYCMPCVLVAVYMCFIPLTYTLLLSHIILCERRSELFACDSSYSIVLTVDTRYRIAM